MATGAFDDPAGGLPLFDRSLRIQALRERTGELKDCMDRVQLRTSAEVLKTVVEPLLAQLGWDLTDPKMVATGAEAGSGKPDFALCDRRGRPAILVKIVVASDSGKNEDDHPFADCDIEALQLAIRGNGREWTFHFPSGCGSLRNREFAGFDIVRDPERDIAEILEDYLAVHAVQSGEAIRQAQLDYGDKRFPAEAPAAWRRSLLGSEILERFAGEIEEATGVPVGGDRAQEFVRRQVDAVPWPADPPDPRPARRIALADKAWVYNFSSREIRTYAVVGSEPDWEAGEVSRDSPIGSALLGAREGETINVALPGQEPSPVRVLLIRRRG